MGRNKKNKPKKELVLNTDADLKLEDTSWEDLRHIKDETIRELYAQQQLVIALVEQHQTVVDADAKLAAAIDGLMKSFTDIAYEIKEANDKLGDKTGPVATYDNYLDYLNIASRYITSQEKIATLSGTAYLDIFTQLKVSEAQLSLLSNTVAAGQAEIEAITPQGEVNGN